MVVYYVGVFYPAALADNGVPGYVIPPADLPLLAQRLVGCPITYEHAGIGAAASTLGPRPSAGTVIAALSRVSARSGDPTQRAISVVDSAYRNSAGDWCCTFGLDEALFPRLVAMIAAGSLRGLSLSHFEHTEGARAPLEVSLCSSPARPGSYITAHGLVSPSAVALYKAFDQLVARHTQPARDMRDNDGAEQR